MSNGIVIINNLKLISSEKSDKNSFYINCLFSYINLDKSDLGYSDVIVTVNKGSTQNSINQSILNSIVQECIGCGLKITTNDIILFPYFGV